MATVDKAIALTILRNNGIYPGDPQCLAVFRYTNDFNGDFAYSICFYVDEINSLLKSPYCHNVVCLWTQTEGFTLFGEALITESGGMRRGNDGPR